MIIILDLPQELESELSAESERLKIPLSEYILSATRPGSNRPRTGAQLVDYWQKEGLIGTRLDIAYSEDYARALRDSAERRTQTQTFCGSLQAGL